MNIYVTIDVEPKATPRGEPAIRSYATEDTLTAAIQHVARACAQYHAQGFSTSFRIYLAGQEWGGTVPAPDAPEAEWRT